MLQWQPLAAVLALTASGAAGVAMLAVRARDRGAAARALALTMSGVSLWALVQMVGVSFNNLGVQRAAALGITPGIGMTVAGYVWLCRLIVDPEARMARPWWITLAAVPAAFTVLPLVAPTGWFFADYRLIGHPSVLAFEVGPALMALGVWNYGLFTLALVGLLRAIRHTNPLQRRQLMILLVASIAPQVMTALSRAQVFGGVDLSATGFLVTAIVDYWAIWRNALLRVVPVARAVVLEQIQDAMIVLAPDGLVLDANASGARLLPLLQDPDGPLAAVSPAHAELLPIVGSAGSRHDVRVQLDGQAVDLEVQLNALSGRRGWITGYVMVARDVTEVRRQQRIVERQRVLLLQANHRQQEQLATIDRLRAELAELAIRDELTGAFNRRYLISTLNAELDRARTWCSALSIVLIDLDHFKRVNDTYGHQAGDAVLVHFVKVLSSLLKPHDLVARYGGEEFVVVLGGTPGPTARNAALRWLHAVSSTPLELDEGHLTVTFSAGVAECAAGWPDVSGLLAMADEALYEAKAAGRARVHLARAWAHVPSRSQ